jgi:hypothetical protein
MYDRKKNILQKAAASHQTFFIKPIRKKENKVKNSKTGRSHPTIPLSGDTRTISN